MKHTTDITNNKTISDISTDTVTIRPCILKGTVTVPPSKSEAHRAIICAALSGGRCVIKNAVLSQDIKATLRGISAFGCTYDYSEETRTLIIDTVKLNTENNTANSDNITEIDCGESGSTIRFLVPVALVPKICGTEASSYKVVSFIGHGRLPERPMQPYFDIFDKQGISYKKDGNRLNINGCLKSGTYEVPGNVSSQFITGLLFALPLLDGDSIINITNGAESKGYIDMTLNMLNTFGIHIENRNYTQYIIKGGQKYTPKDITLEGDFSQAAFFLIAGAIGGDVTCLGLNPNSLQGDKAILDIIKKTGAEIEYDPQSGGYRAVHTAVMHGIEVDASEIPDLVPILSVLFAFCKGKSKIINAGRLRIKESDRLASTQSELSRLGANIIEGYDSLTINGVHTLTCNTVSSRNDHRIAMALAIALCRAEGDAAVISDALSAVKKSYPDFFDVYKSLQK